MAVTATVRAGGRWLASAATVCGGIALLTPIITTSAVFVGSCYVADKITKKLIDMDFASMITIFNGNETERNWTARQKIITYLRKYINSTTPKEYPTNFFPGIKSVSDGIIKAALSLRTTLSANACALIKELAIAFGSSLEPALLEKFLQPMISLCGHTKTLNRKHGDDAVIAIVNNASINPGVLRHITASANDKNHSTRMCTANWVKLMIQKNGHHCEPHGGLELIDQCIRTGLQDAKLDVRETMRDTYWTFARIWPDRAESIMSSLDAKAQKTLHAHPNKPADIIQPEVKATASSTVTPGPAKLSIKELKLAAMRAKATSTNEIDEGLQTISTVIPGPAKSSIKELKLTAMRAKAASTNEIDDGLQTTSTVTPGPATLSIKELKLAAMRAKATSTTEIDDGLQTTLPPPTSTFIVTAGPSTLSAPPKRRGRPAPASRPATPDDQLAAPSVVSELVGSEPVISELVAPELVTPELVAPEPVVSQPTVSQPTIVVPAFDIRSVPLAQRDPVRIREQENIDTTTHKHMWNNKETAERRRSISPRSRDPEEARQHLTAGIQRIKSRSIDDHGYRKLQGLITSHDRIFRDEQKYDELLLALFDALETPNTERRTPLGRPLDNKFQILVTIRLMLEHNRKYCAAYYPRALSALLLARRNFQTRNHIVSGLEETAKDIVAQCIPADAIDTVIDVLETEVHDEAGSRTIAMGLHILSGLSARMKELQAVVEPHLQQRMAKFGLKCLREPTSIVRRATIEYCLELKRHITPEKRFYRLVTGNNEDLKNLLTYYAHNTE